MAKPSLQSVVGTQTLELLVAGQGGDIETKRVPVSTHLITPNRQQKLVILVGNLFLYEQVASQYLRDLMQFNAANVDLIQARLDYNRAAETAQGDLEKLRAQIISLANVQEPETALLTQLRNEITQELLKVINTSPPFKAEGNPFIVKADKLFDFSTRVDDHNTHLYLEIADQAKKLDSKIDALEEDDVETIREQIEDQFILDKNFPLPAIANEIFRRLQTLSPENLTAINALARHLEPSYYAGCELGTIAIEETLWPKEEK
jgi:hypothetical protein